MHRNELTLSVLNELISHRNTKSLCSFPVKTRFVRSQHLPNPRIRILSVLIPQRPHQLIRRRLRNPILIILPLPISKGLIVIRSILENNRHRKQPQSPSRKKINLKSQLIQGRKHLKPQTHLRWLYPHSNPIGHSLFFDPSNA